MQCSQRPGTKPLPVELWPVAAGDSGTNHGHSSSNASLAYRQMSGADKVYFSMSF